ncbi:MAG: D-glycero-beta-D-manno-heptose 1-phosphate adenylyltransferase [Chitinophagales bacterium]
MKQKVILDKICDKSQLAKKIALWRFLGRKIIFTNGCFDVLHAGHTHLLNTAADLVDHGVLIIGLNSDASVSRLKGEKRPVNSLIDRATVLASLYAVSAVIEFTEDTPAQLIENIKPDILVKGGDYQVEDIAGADFVIAHGGRVEIIPFLKGYSTTEILQKGSK